MQPIAIGGTKVSLQFDRLGCSMRRYFIDGFCKLLYSLLNSMVKHDSLDSPVFIWGAPRSGTTLLYELIAKHPDVGYPSTDAKKPREGTGFWWRAFGEHRGVIDVSLAHPKCVYQVRNEYASMLKAQGKSRLLDKTPFMTLWIPLVNEIFPNARHFHVIRDGRAVVNSILYKLRYSERDRDRPFREGKLLFGPQPPALIDPMSQPPAQCYVRQWMLLVEHGRQNAKLLGERYFELRYEDLVDAPRTWMKSVLDHAQLEYDEQFIDKSFPTKLTSRNYKWKSDKKEFDGYTAHRALNPSDMPYLEEMNPLLRLLGYQVEEGSCYR